MAVRINLPELFPWCVVGHTKQYDEKRRYYAYNLLTSKCTVELPLPKSAAPWTSYARQGRQH